MYRIKNLKDTYSETRSKVIETMNTFVLTQKLKFPIPLGPGFNDLEPHEVDAHLRAHRMSKSWQLPADADKAARKEKSIRDMLMFDAGGPDRNYNPIHQDECPEVRRILALARLDLYQALRRHYRFVPSRLRIPKGETAKSARGDVSLFAKLRDQSQWCVTADCFDAAARVIYDVPGLKSSFKAAFPEYDQKDLECLHLAFSDSKGRVDGFEVFKVRLLDVVTIVDGMRLETVPKDNDKDRVIACEPLLNMLVQSVVEEGIRHVILHYYGIDLDVSQVLHGTLISDLLNATVDLKNASNSFFLNGLDALYAGTKLRSDILSCRSPIASHGTEDHVLKMVAPMGNGFTFGYMTLTLLAICRVMDNESHVYGDDIIINAGRAETLIACTNALGCSVNVDKTFFTGGFRESCGKFYSTDHYVLSYEFTYPESIVECVTLVNKVFQLAQLGLDDWVALHASLLLHFNPVHYMWHRIADLPVKDPTKPFGAEIESRYLLVYKRSDMRKKKLNAMSRSLWSAEVATRKRWLEETQYESKHVCAVAHISYCVDSYRALPVDDVHGALASYYLFTGRCTAPTRRTSVSKRKINTHVSLVSYWSEPLTYPQRTN